MVKQATKAEVLVNRIDSEHSTVMLAIRRGAVKPAPAMCAKGRRRAQQLPGWQKRGKGTRKDRTG